ncbi:hypothetical protein HW555_007700 [Spodoptera exigua]|uniref:Ciliogenesis-associated TTC17-interacting protein N-terminal domain-containing protein n=1 Tax=Spodoptera exigua TaxID=7107 RepID=A0A835GFS7_SPOEX|nr:hypothetical protein HW555_007700 [Spodoptera exigua]
MSIGTVHRQPYIFVDAAIKEEICFGETLIISCGHYEGDLEEEESESEWSCEDSSETTVSEEAKGDQAFEIKDYVPEPVVQEEQVEEDNDFSFYFFPDCDKPPPPQNSKTSVVVVDGMPKLNIAAKTQIYCTCKKDKSGDCPCFLKIPCSCTPETKTTCTCSELKDICVCAPGHPQITCKCESASVCTCDPTGKIMPVCTCGQIDKPCICHPDKYPCPVCQCKHKPRVVPVSKSSQPTLPTIESYETASIEGELSKKTSQDSKMESVIEAVNEASVVEEEPCACQKPDPKNSCLCLKGKDCTCLSSCACGIQSTCLCEPEECQDLPCKEGKNKSISCTCDAPKDCKCSPETTSGICKCFPVKICTCKNPENCKCFTTCDCTNPCICDTAPVKSDECVCLSKPEISDLVCTCRRTDDTAAKIKKLRKGKHGYRWCHEVDPRHTFFNYAYGRHEKLKTEETINEQFQIKGLHDKQHTDECPIHGPKLPKFEKKPRKPSLDCCSAVGGISICVESLGEDKDKLLVQMVSHSSKEGAKTGSKLVSILDCNLHTMEENRVEHATKKDLTKERRSYMAICENGYYNKVTRICGQRDVVKRFYHDFDKARNFVLEGANLVLLRYMAVRRFKGTVKTDTVMMDGTICESVYISHGVSQGIVNATPFFVVKIERHVIEPSGYMHQTLTVLTLRGYTVSHEWADNCYIFHINPLLRVVPERDEIEKTAPLRDSWRHDLQLMSDFLEFKSTRMSEGGRYVTESGTLTGTVRDFLQTILLLRPQDTLHFTRHYFATVLSALDLPHDEFFDPASKHVRYYFFEE